MPIRYDKENPKLYDRARVLFFDEGIKSPAKIRGVIKNEFGENMTPHWRTFDRWCDSWQAEKSIGSAISKLTTAERASSSAKQEPIIQAVEPLPGFRVKRVKPPELQELLLKGIDLKIALKLLANWDVAYGKSEEPSHEPDEKPDEELGAYETTVFQTAVSIFADCPGIPYDKAIALATLEVQAEEFELDKVKDYVRFYKRYEGWKGGDHLKAFDEVYDRLYPLKMSERRQKRASAGIFSRLFNMLRRDSKTAKPIPRKKRA
jgi:hypothetical protein